MTWSVIPLAPSWRSQAWTGEGWGEGVRTHKSSMITAPSPGAVAMPSRQNKSPRPRRPLPEGRGAGSHTPLTSHRERRSLPHNGVLCKHAPNGAQHSHEIVDFKKATVVGRTSSSDGFVSVVPSYSRWQPCSLQRLGLQLQFAPMPSLNSSRGH